MGVERPEERVDVGGEVDAHDQGDAVQVDAPTDNPVKIRFFIFCLTYFKLINCYYRDCLVPHQRLQVGLPFEADVQVEDASLARLLLHLLSILP